MTSYQYSKLHYDLLRKAYGLDSDIARVRKAETEARVWKVTAYVFMFAFALSVAFL